MNLWPMGVLSDRGMGAGGTDESVWIERGCFPIGKQPLFLLSDAGAPSRRAGGKWKKPLKKDAGMARCNFSEKRSIGLCRGRV